VLTPAGEGRVRAEFDATQISAELSLGAMGRFWKITLPVKLLIKWQNATDNELEI
jgi:hypothetical protein